MVHIVIIEAEKGVKIRHSKGPRELGMEHIFIIKAETRVKTGIDVSRFKA